MVDILLGVARLKGIDHLGKALRMIEQGRDVFIADARLGEVGDLSDIGFDMRFEGIHKSQLAGIGAQKLKLIKAGGAGSNAMKSLQAFPGLKLPGEAIINHIQVNQSDANLATDDGVAIAAGQVVKAQL